MGSHDYHASVEHMEQVEKRRDLREDLELCDKATPGPWQWDVNKHFHGVRLESYKWVVMDFVRWGMNGAQPCFLQEGILEKASDLAIERKAHHVGFDMDIIHPDAQFISQARTGWPEAIHRAMEAEKRVTELEDILQIDPQGSNVIDELNDTIAHLRIQLVQQQTRAIKAEHRKGWEGSVNEI